MDLFKALEKNVLIHYCTFHVPCPRQIIILGADLIFLVVLCFGIVGWGGGGCSFVPVFSGRDRKKTECTH